MTSVTFRDSLVYTADHPVSVKTAYESFAAYAGIHDVHFGGDVHNPWLRTELWESYNGSIWSIDEDALIGESASGTHDIVGRNDLGRDGINTFTSFDIEFTAEGSGGFIFKRSVSPFQPVSQYYLIEWSSSEIVFYRYRGGLERLNSIPIGFTGEADVRIMVREFQYSSIESDRWLNVAVWIDGEYVFAASTKISLERLGNSIGFRVKTGGSITWDREFHPAFAVPLDWGILDPGESPMAGLQRALGERHIRHFVRFDGSLMVLRPGTRPVNFAVGHSDFDVEELINDSREIVTHLRVWSAVNHVEVFDPELVQLYGRRFAEINNPNIYTAYEAQEEGLSILEKIHAASLRISFAMPYQSLIEPEDTIYTPQGKFTVDSADVKLNGNKMTMTVNGRKYVYK